MLIGDGPELPRVRAEAAGVTRDRVHRRAAARRMPAALSAADIGVAPFDAVAHAPLSLGFYWSPLKIFEYMAAGLPVVAPSIERIRTLVEDGREGLLYDPNNPAALSDALRRLTLAPLRAQLGAAARARAVRDYSWSAHCRALDAAFRDAAGRRVPR